MLSGYPWSVAVQITISLMLTASIVCILTALELVYARGPLLPVRERLRALGFVALYSVVGVLVGPAFRMFKLDAGSVFPTVGLLDAIIAVLVFDFVYYWYHRAQHSIPWLWRFHSVHHAQPLGAGAGYHHLLEIPLKAVLVSVPASLLFGGHYGAIFAALMSLHGFYVHSTTKLNFGPLAWALCDNRVHRIHHSTDPAHYSRNFGVVTLAWDKMFGTAYMPKNEWPEVGLSDRPAALSVRDYLRLSRGRLFNDLHLEPRKGREDRNARIGTG